MQGGNETHEKYLLDIYIIAKCIRNALGIIIIYRFKAPLVPSKVRLKN